MDVASDRFDSDRLHHDRLLRDVIDQRDAVLDPSRDVDHREFAARLRDTLLEHERAEERYLYDRVDDLADAPLITDGLRMDHEEIEHRIEALETSDPDGASLPLQLHELTALVEHHFQKEAEILYPFLEDVLDEEEFEIRLDRLPHHDGVEYRDE